MKSKPRVRHATVAVLVLLGLLASQSAFALECWVVCKCRSQCSNPCTDAGEPSTCGGFGLCECGSLQASRATPAGNTAVLAPQAPEPDFLAGLLGTSCTAPPAPSPAPAR